MEINKLKDWKGIGEEFPSPEGVVSDYDRACEVDDYLGLVKVNGDYDALVLGVEPMGTAWLNIAKMGIIVRWEFGETEEEIEHLVENMSLDKSWEKSGVFLEFFSKELVVFDAAADFTCLDDQLDVEIEPSKYEMETAFYKPNNLTSLVLHRFKSIE